jgi:hypothetical protein
MRSFLARHFAITHSQSILVTVVTSCRFVDVAMKDALCEPVQDVYRRKRSGAKEVLNSRYGEDVGEQECGEIYPVEELHRALGWVCLVAIRPFSPEKRLRRYLKEREAAAGVL